MEHHGDLQPVYHTFKDYASDFERVFFLTPLEVSDFDHNSDHNSRFYPLVSIGVHCQNALISRGLLACIFVNWHKVTNSNPVTSTQQKPLKTRSFRGFSYA